MDRQILTASELTDWLQLARTENIGAITFRQLLDRFASVAYAIDALPEIAKKGGRSAFKVPSRAMIEDEIAHVMAMDGVLLPLSDPRYPPALRLIEDAPPVLTVLGRISLLATRSVAIIGARKGSKHSLDVAARFASELGAAHLSTVSGLARGVDTAALRAALPTGAIAVLPGGIDIVYPEENRALYEDLIETGCLLSDQPFKREPFARLFANRNRIISGLAEATLAIEAVPESGAYMTAETALEQGRHVFITSHVIPDLLASGLHGLIGEGATVVSNPGELINQLSSSPALRPPKPIAPRVATLRSGEENEMPIARAILIEFLSDQPVLVTELTQRSGLCHAVVLTVLLELELAGRVERKTGDRVVLSSAHEDVENPWLSERSISA